MKVNENIEGPFRTVNRLLPKLNPFQDDRGLLPPSPPRVPHVLQRLDERPRLLHGPLFRLMSEHSHQGAYPEKIPPWEELTLEHVFPVNPGSEWSDEMKADPELREEYVHRLGNLCLLQKKPNKEASGKGFPFKKEQILAKSELTLTSAIGQSHDKWDRASIEHRQEALGNLALIAWPLPQS